MGYSREMEPLPCFLYRLGEHFELPPEFGKLSKVTEFVQRDAQGNLLPHPAVFRQVSNPEDAAVFLFPYEIGAYVATLHTEAIGRIIKALPFYPGRERRHIVCDYCDYTVSIPQPVCLFKVSATTDSRTECVVMPFGVSPHVAEDKPEFDWAAIRYDTSFVGNLTHPLRRALVTAIRHQAPELRVLADYDSLFVPLDEDCFTLRDRDADEERERQALFRRSVKQSLTVLCPPGVGPQSVRMYETMYLGRIPVLFGDKTIYPLQDKVDYDSFCLRVRDEDIPDIGHVLRKWLTGQNAAELHERCLLACKTWNRFFVTDKCLQALLEEAGNRYWN